MPELWARDSSAVNRKFRELHGSADGVNRKFKELWARDQSAVNRKIFSNAITWTYTVETPANPQETFCYPSNNVSCHLEYSGDLLNSDVKGIVTYIFAEPFVMRAGQTINGLFTTTGYHTTYHVVWLNGSYPPIFDEDVNENASVPSLYTFSSDILISTIKCEIYFDSMSRISADMVIKINGSFALNNSGTSEGQV